MRNPQEGPGEPPKSPGKPQKSFTRAQNSSKQLSGPLHVGNISLAIANMRGNTLTVRVFRGSLARNTLTVRVFPRRASHKKKCLITGLTGSQSAARGALETGPGPGTYI